MHAWKITNVKIEIQTQNRKILSKMVIRKSVSISCNVGFYFCHDVFLPSKSVSPKWISDYIATFKNIHNILQHQLNNTSKTILSSNRPYIAWLVAHRHIKSTTHTLFLFLITHLIGFYIKLLLLDILQYLTIVLISYSKLFRNLVSEFLDPSSENLYTMVHKRSALYYQWHKKVMSPSILMRVARALK